MVIEGIEKINTVPIDNIADLEEDCASWKNSELAQALGVVQQLFTAQEKVLVDCGDFEDIHNLNY